MPQKENARCMRRAHVSVSSSPRVYCVYDIFESSDHARSCALEQQILCNIEHNKIEIQHPPAKKQIIDILGTFTTSYKIVF